MIDDRRIADHQFRADIGQRLTAIEVSTKLYHDEIKSIIEGMHKDLATLTTDLSTLRWTLYGGPAQNDVGLLEKFRQLLWKAGLITSAALAAGSFLMKPVSRMFDKWVTKELGEDPIAQMVQQSTSKRMQLFNRKTGEYEYYMMYQPVGVVKGKKAPNP